MNKYAIITENDVSDWEDETGARYHFPNKYLKILEVGTKVIYYKGKIKDNFFKNKRLSDNPHYFGVATIGNIWQDKINSKNYFSEVIDYRPFYNEVYFKNSNGEYFEKIPNSKVTNYWRDGVRSISKEVYDDIVSLSGLNDYNIIEGAKNESFKNIQLELVEEDILKCFSSENRSVKSGVSKAKYSSESKRVGDLGEKYVFAYLKDLLSKKSLETLIWHANIGETPGYDISYIDDKDMQIFIEVKTTSGKLFNNFIMTINEIDVAKELGDAYKIFLVSDCFSDRPKLNIIDNPTLDDDFKFNRNPPMNPC